MRNPSIVSLVDVANPDSLLMRLGEVWIWRHTGASRYLVSKQVYHLDPGFRREDDFKHIQAASIGIHNDALAGYILSRYHF